MTGTTKANAVGKLAPLAAPIAAGVTIGLVTAVVETWYLVGRYRPYFDNAAVRLSYWLWPIFLYAAAGAALGGFAAVVGAFAAGRHAERTGREATALGVLVGLVGFVLATAADVELRAAAPDRSRMGGLDVLVLAGLALVVAVVAVTILRRAWPRLARFLRPALVAGAVAGLVATGALGAYQVALARQIERTPANAVAATPEAPNLLLLTVDTLRADALGCYGNELAITPNLDRLAREGALFERTYTPMVCTDPAHASILTSRMPNEHRLTRNGVKPRFRKIRTLAEVLREHGFRTFAAVSVEHLDAGLSALSRGFQSYLDCSPWDRFAQHGLFRLRALLPRPSESLEAKRHERPGREVVSDLLRWLERDRGDDSRFFAWLHLFDPHYPYAPFGSTDHAEVEAAYQSFRRAVDEKPDGSTADPAVLARLMRGYAADVTLADAEVGRLLDALERRGILGRTLVVVIADHGEHLAEPWVPATSWFSHADVVDETAHVPMLMRLPGKIHPGTRVTLEASSIDVAPTALGLLGFPAQAAFRGRDLGAALAGDASSIPRVPIVTDSNPNSPIQAWAVREDGWALVVRDEGASVALFEGPADPVRSRDRAVSEPERVARLTEQGERERVRKKPREAAQSIGAANAEMLKALGYAQ